MTTTELDARILEKVRKTLALASDKGATEAEREVALKMAHGLLAKHNLSLAQVEQAGKHTPAQRTMNRTTFYGRPWAQTVAWAVAKLCFCEYVVTPAHQAKDTRHWFIGRESNAISAGELSKFLVESILRESKRRARQAGEGSTFARSFASGAAATVARRVKEMMEESAKQTAEGSTPGTSLVLASVYATEREANIAFRDSQMRVKAGSKRNSAGVDPYAFGRGAEYGKELQLGRQLGGTSQKQLTGGN